MLSEKVEVLRLARNHPGITLTGVLEHYEMRDYRRHIAHVSELIADGYLSDNVLRGLHDLRDDPFRPLSLTSKGEELLEKLDKDAAEHAKQQADKQAAEAKHLSERREDHANEERRHREQNKIAVEVAILSVLLSFLVAHIGQIVSFIMKIFH